MTQHIKEQVIPFEQLKSSDLIIDCVYQSGKDDHLGSEVISRLVPFCQNTGGFRWVKRLEKIRRDILAAQNEKQKTFEKLLRISENIAYWEIIDDYQDYKQQDCENKGLEKKINLNPNKLRTKYITNSNR